MAKWSSKIISSAYARERDFILLMFVLSLIALKSKVLKVSRRSQFIQRKMNGKRVIRASEPTCWGPVVRPCLRGKLGALRRQSLFVWVRTQFQTVGTKENLQKAWEKVSVLRQTAHWSLIPKLSKNDWREFKTP